MVSEGDLLWTPSPERIEQANLTAFARYIAERYGQDLPDYQLLWRWSVENLEDFWESLRHYFEIEFSTAAQCVLGSKTMPGATWFPGARLNYAEQIFRKPGSPDATALIAYSERRPPQEISWSQLRQSVEIAARRLRQLGIEPGDRVVGYMPNIPEAAVAILATTAIGAIWSSCSPDFGTRSVLDRFVQIEPKLLFCVDGYRYRGKDFDRRQELDEIVGRLPSLEHVVHLPYLDPQRDSALQFPTVSWRELMESDPATDDEFDFEQVPFDHPLWILFSSGTTGMPKAIVHGHGGITLEFLKAHSFHQQLCAGDRMFFYTTTGWMMWNYVVGALLVGATPVLYDGHPAYPGPETLWRIAAETDAALFGASPSYQQMLQQSGFVPKEHFAFPALMNIFLAGSPVSPECMKWFYDNVKEDVLVGTGSGGTDVCTGFTGLVPNEPLYAAEAQGRCLGVDACAFNDAGQPVVDEVGELVIRQPMPSMPVFFWKDPDGRRYREAYFEDFPGVWRHGDFFRINSRGGSLVLGRSDATLNRYGVRIGTAEVYRCLQNLPEVVDSLIVNLDLPGGKFFMPLFVTLAEGVALDDQVKRRINATLRAELSPRHVPDEIYEITTVPYTLTGKKMEIPVRRILMGKPVAEVANRDAMADPSALDYFVRFTAERRSST